jgi:hypothetical protein
MGKIYQFRSLSPDEQDAVLSEIYRRYQIGNNLSGSIERIRHIIIICKLLKARQNLSALTKEERFLYRSVHLQFDNIQNVGTLDLCLLYWLMTRNSEYQLKLQKVIHDLYSPVRDAAKRIHQNYPEIAENVTSQN